MQYDNEMQDYDTNRVKRRKSGKMEENPAYFAEMQKI